MADMASGTQQDAPTYVELSAEELQRFLPVLREAVSFLLPCGLTEIRQFLKKTFPLQRCALTPESQERLEEAVLRLAVEICAEKPHKAKKLRREKVHSAHSSEIRQKQCVERDRRAQGRRSKPDVFPADASSPERTPPPQRQPLAQHLVTPSPRTPRSQRVRKRPRWLSEVDYLLGTPQQSEGEYFDNDSSDFEGGEEEEEMPVVKIKKVPKKPSVPVARSGVSAPMVTGNGPRMSIVEPFSPLPQISRSLASAPRVFGFSNPFALLSPGSVP
eukprot:TRINITY_DN27855_c0_g1_i1.p1 TRINITY_DN27855_c0_g1~~TRINITY_DN27855_c0_g1_i1.p1  ORF type:complete len:273 (+),score=36.45 TRINITY_DN27855_c0_g1_i1:29-847(+)